MDLLPLYLQVNLAFAVLLAGYALGLRHSPLLGARRAFLLLAPVLALFLPHMPSMTVTAAFVPIALPAITVLPTPEVVEGPARTLWAMHGAVSLLLLGRLLWRIVAAWRVVRRAGPNPLAFLGRVHLPEHLAGAEREAIHQHELAHVRLGHSYDLIAYEVLAALCWTNPLWWVALRELRLVHELQADRIADR